MVNIQFAVTFYNYFQWRRLFVVIIPVILICLIQWYTRCCNNAPFHYCIRRYCGMNYGLSIKFLQIPH